MAYIPNTLWPDAARYGAGLGQALTQGFMEVPAQRAQQQIQLGQLAEQRQQAAQNMAFQQQQLENQRTAQQELSKYHGMLADIGALKAKTASEAEAKKPSTKYNVIFGPNRIPLGTIDEYSGNVNWFGGAGGGPGGGVMQPPVGSQPATTPPGGAGTGPAVSAGAAGGGQTVPFNLGALGGPTAQQEVSDKIRIADLMMKGSLGGASTNNPALWNAVTNFGMPLLLGGQRTATPQIAAPGAAPATNAPVAGGGGRLQKNPQTGEMEWVM